MKTYKETAHDVLMRVRQEEEERKMKQKRMKRLIPAAAILLVLLGVGIALILQNSRYSGGSEAGGEEPELESAKEAVGREVIHRSEVLTAEEAMDHVNKNLQGYVNQLNASGVPVESLHVRGNAYSMLNLGKKKNELADNFRYILLYDQDDRLKAIQSLGKENGRIYESLSFGGPWFDEFSSLLDEYQGQELVCVFFRYSDVLIAPDNRILMPQGYDTDKYFPAGTDYYSAFKTPDNVLIP
ncbi:MAG: hypothetical protein IJL98_08530 [Lachnospiraceae bacterium]|nr:hypothetical protein [Lachnospiraceae bacterium]